MEALLPPGNAGAFQRSGGVFSRTAREGKVLRVMADKVRGQHRFGVIAGIVFGPLLVAARST